MDDDLKALSDDELRREIGRRLVAAQDALIEQASRSHLVDWDSFLREHPELERARWTMIAQLYGFGLSD
jgi:hypothetical protein